MSKLVRSSDVIGYESAAKLVAEAISHAKQNNWNIAVTILDPAGSIVASARMDSVSPIVLEIALDKAFTATLGKSTTAFFERMSSSPDLTLGLQTRQRLCAWDGGLPILLDGKLVGAIGVSGAAGPEDVACAKAALSAVGFDTA